MKSKQMKSKPVLYDSVEYWLAIRQNAQEQFEKKQERQVEESKDCHKRQRAMLFICGGQICARCVSGATEVLPDSHAKVAIIKKIRSLCHA